MTLGESVTLLVDELTPAGKPVREVSEVANHREGLVAVFQAIVADEPLTDQLVTTFHAALMDHLLPDRGQYKTSGNAIVGAAFAPTPPERVPEAMRQWADQTDWQTRNLDGAPLLEAIAASHIAFERIHPFSDGNGRTGRLVLAYQTILRFDVPAIITADLRPTTWASLRTRTRPGSPRSSPGCSPTSRKLRGEPSDRLDDPEIARSGNTGPSGPLGNVAWSASDRAQKEPRMPTPPAVRTPLVDPVGAPPSPRRARRAAALVAAAVLAPPPRWSRRRPLRLPRWSSSPTASPRESAVEQPVLDRGQRRGVRRAGAIPTGGGAICSAASTRATTRTSS